MPIRVLHIVANMNRGGLENFIMNVYRTIDKEEVQFDFLVTREVEGAFDEEIRLLGGRIYNIPQMAKVGYKKYKRILYLFFKEHPDYKIVHCHRDALCGIYLKQAKRVGIPVRIAHSHNTQLVEEKNCIGKMKVIFKNYLKKSIHRYSTHYFACGQLAGEWLFGKQIGKNDLKVIKNGIDTKRYKYSAERRERIRRKLGIKENDFLIGHIGRFELQKNHKFLLRIFQSFYRNVPNSKMYLIGGGILQEEINKEISRLGIEKAVIRLGIREDVPDLLAAFDLFVFPSLFEGLPVALVEAQASGIPCVISDQISKEVDLGMGLIEYLSIEQIELWVEYFKKIYSRSNELEKSRYTNIEQMISSGYDIGNSARYLQKFYLETQRGEKNETIINGIYANI